MRESLGGPPMERRAFMTLVGALAAVLPQRVVAQPVNRVYRVGFLVPIPAIAFMSWLDELARLGFVEGRNLEVDRRGFAAAYDQFPTIAAELVRSGLDALICGGDAAIRAAQAATASIPIIASTDDMVGAGLVQS